MKEIKLSVSVLLFLFVSFCTVFSDVIFEDDFETDKGWSLVNTSSKGNWERGDPQGTNYQLNVTPGAGYYALVTDGRGGSDSYYDVDGGKTAIQSPEIQLPSSGNITISFYYYLGHRYDAESIDYFRVKIKVGSSETVILEELGNTGEDRPSSYDQFNTSLNSFAGQTIRVLIEAADNSGTILEASVDELKIESESGILPQVYETPNYPSNYPNYVNETETIGKHPDWGCTGYEIQVIGESEDNYDYLYLRQNGQNLCDPIHGDLGTEGITVVVENDDPVDVTFTSDRSVTEQGFHVEAVASPGCQGPGPTDVVACRYSYGSWAGGATYAHPDDNNGNGKYLIGGWFDHGTPSDAILIKTDPTGGVIEDIDHHPKVWTDTYLENHIRDVETVPSGGYIVLLRERVMRLHNDFTDVVGWPNFYYAHELASVCNTSDGGFFLGDCNKRIFKLKRDGYADLTFNSQGSPGYIDLVDIDVRINCVFQTNDTKSYIVVSGGATHEAGTETQFLYASPFNIAEIPENGDVGSIVYIEFPELASCGGSYGIQTSDGGFLFTGNNDTKAFLLKTNRSFQVEFLREYPGLLFGFGVTEAKSGDYVLAGVTDAGASGHDFAILKVDRIGNPLDDRPFMFPGDANDGSC
ncbi:hypothetical protein ACFL5S_01935 [Fibrobacterota bacterium]